MTTICPIPAQTLFRAASVWDLCLQINIIGIDHTHKAYLCIDKGIQSISLVSVYWKEGSSHKIYMNTDDEGSCAQFREWHIWTYKLLWFVYTLKNLKKNRKERKRSILSRRATQLSGEIKKRQHQTSRARVTEMAQILAISLTTHIFVSQSLHWSSSW